MNKFWYIHVPRFIIIINIIAFTVAMMIFPGGNHLEVDQIGYSFTKNFISELGRFKSMSGDVNFFSSFIFLSTCCLNIFLGIAFLKIPKLFKQNKSFDFIYIDGSHNGEDILSDAIEAFKILKKEGLIFFDDFLQYDKNRVLQSYDGIEKFLNLYSNYLKIEYFQNNLVVRKK